MNKKHFLLAALLFLIVSLAGCAEESAEQKDQHEEESGTIIMLSTEALGQIKLTTYTSSLKPISGFITIPAEVKTRQDNEAHIGSLIHGRVHQVFVKVGDYVKSGQVLMTVEGLEIGEIKAGYLKAKAGYEYAKANYERQVKLNDENIGSRKSLLESLSEFEKALAEYQGEDRKIHSVGLTDEDVLSEKTGDEHKSGTLPIKSLIEGFVVERNVVIGQQVDASTSAFKIISIRSVWIDGQIYEKDLNTINTGSKAVFTSASTKDYRIEGKIIYVGLTVDDNTRTILVRGEFDNPGNKLKPQMFGELQIPAGSNIKALMVPAGALFTENGEQYLFVQTGNGTFEKKNVTAGVSLNDMTEIKKGLSEGEKVVTEGVFYLKSELHKDEIEGHGH